MALTKNNTRQWLFRYWKFSMKIWVSLSLFFKLWRVNLKYMYWLGLGFWLTNKYQNKFEYRSLWQEACVLPTQNQCIHLLQVCNIVSKHMSNFFFCLNHALSCMLSHPYHLPCHCSLLELKMKEFHTEDAKRKNWSPFHE